MMYSLTWSPVLRATVQNFKQQDVNVIEKLNVNIQEKQGLFKFFTQPFDSKAEPINTSWA